MEIKTEDVEQFFHGMPDEEIRENWINIRCLVVVFIVVNDLMEIAKRLNANLLTGYLVITAVCIKIASLPSYGKVRLIKL